MGNPTTENWTITETYLQLHTCSRDWYVYTAPLSLIRLTGFGLLLQAKRVSHSNGHCSYISAYQFSIKVAIHVQQ